MKFELTASFLADRDRLSKEELGLVRERLPEFVAACDRYAADASNKWPGSFRARGVQGAPGVLEVTFHFGGPDIRATFEWVRIEGELAIRWRRIGGQRIFSEP